jgi:UDP-N-acetylglucosamine diphosphorylase / glucose-1-phosphate thymidylyltransferase / UDP-N-acetylgalactosamine diphosphorylase / glucosamine-1-phosphate N-acetyltransferase / galactosamine-1-phosphate N-acetyltransferase
MLATTSDLCKVVLEWETHMSATQAVLLVAGKGKRMLPLTETRPKPLQEVLGKNLIEWKLLSLPASISEVILVVGYQGNQIQEFFGDTWGKLSIRYALQEELNGTGGALWSARELLDKRFLVMMGDDLYAHEDVRRMMEHDWAVCIQEVHQKEMGGEMLLNTDGTFLGINEERQMVENGFVNTGMYMLGKEIFDYPLTPIGGSSTEFGLPHTLARLAKDIPVQTVLATKWMQITSPEDLKRAETFVEV